MQRFEHYRTRFAALPLDKKIVVGLGLLVEAGFLVGLFLMLLELVQLASSDRDTASGAVLILGYMLLIGLLPEDADMGYVFMQVFWLSLLALLALALAATMTTFILRGALLPAVGSGVMFGVAVGYVIQGYAEAVYGVFMGIMHLIERGAAALWDRLNARLQTKPEVQS